LSILFLKNIKKLYIFKKALDSQIQM
jgi:hypothetical protein